MKLRLLPLTALLLLAAGCASQRPVPTADPVTDGRSRYGNGPIYEVYGRRYVVLDSSQGYREHGIASWYGKKFHGRLTSSRERYDMYAMTAAHKSLPLPTYVEVRNLRNGKKVIVKVNDRGPFHDNRVIDLSYAAAARLDILEAGTGLVEVRSIDPVRYAGNSGAPVDNRAASADTGLPGDPGAGFYIQVGAYARLDNALKMRERLGGLGGGMTNVSEAVINGGRVYRVRIGPLTDITTADSIVVNLRTRGVHDHYITLD